MERDVDHVATKNVNPSEIVRNCTSDGEPLGNCRVEAPGETVHPCVPVHPNTPACHREPRDTNSEHGAATCNEVLLALNVSKVCSLAVDLH